MEIVALVVVAVLGAVCATLVAGRILRREPTDAIEPPPRQWKSDTVTPVILGARNRAPERVARGFVVTQGALLAAHMAAVDGTISEGEREAIRGFIRDRVTGGTAEMAAKALERAEAELPDSTVVDAAVDALRALGSDEQRQLVLELLAHVARADGAIHASESAFMQRIGHALGLSEKDVQARLEVS